jgi:hypothetical protein
MTSIRYFHARVAELEARRMRVKWLRGLAAKGGNGTVDNIDARALGAIADEIKHLRARAAKLEAALEVARQEIAKAKELQFSGPASDAASVHKTRASTAGNSRIRPAPQSRRQ